MQNRLIWEIIQTGTNVEMTENTVFVRATLRLNNSCKNLIHQRTGINGTMQS